MTLALQPEVVERRPFNHDEILLEAFLTSYKGRTRDAYESDMALWRHWLEDNDVPLLGPGVLRVHIERFARDEEVRGLKPSSISRRLGTICMFYRYAHMEGIMERDIGVHVRRPKVPSESTTLGLDREELSKFVLAASQMPPKFHAIACLLGLNGLRVSELCSLDVENISRERGHSVITFVGKGDKPAVAPLAPRTLRAVLLLLEERTHGPLFVRSDGRRMDRHTAARYVKYICRAAGIKKRISPHSLRHSFITAALDAGVPLRDVQWSARHADPRTTMRYDRGRHGLDQHCTYVVAAFLVGE